MEVNEAQRLKQLEDENRRLKQLVADLRLDKEILKALIHKRRMGGARRRADVSFVLEQFGVSARRACGLVMMPVSSYSYKLQPGKDEELRQRLLELAQDKPRFGYRRLHVLLCRSGERINHKRVHRIYQEAGLTLRRKKRKHLSRTGVMEPLTASNQEWAADFISDGIATGQSLRILSVVEGFDRRCLELEPDTSFAGLRVTRVLDQALDRYGRPQRLRVDNGPEFTSRHFLAWAVERKIEIVYIRPGRPVENAYVESFHGRLREECLNVSWFRNLWDARAKLACWRDEYNRERPHSSLGYRTPEEFAAQCSFAPPSLCTAGDRRRQGCPDGSLRSALTAAPACQEVLNQRGEGEKTKSLISS
jgi:putative transposase